jgi:hypothetical protein
MKKRRKNNRPYSNKQEIKNSKFKSKLPDFQLVEELE